MTVTELRKRESRAEYEPLVILRKDDPNTFLVYAASAPAKQYAVDVSTEYPTCTCPDFQRHRTDPDWRCKHILAVQRQGNGPPSNGQTLTSTGSSDSPAFPGQILVRRSASPDGRIDSLTVEWTWPVDEDLGDQVTERAIAILAIADEVIGRYLGPRPTSPAPARAMAPTNGRPTNGRPTNGHGVLPAELVGVGAMDGRWGRRLYLRVESNGTSLRFYGSAKELADALANAGYSHFSGNVVEGATFNLPCRVVTKPSANGRFQDVQELLPPEAPPQQRRWAS